jgi:asparagine synthase (glutamine-hydrolysing)
LFWTRSAGCTRFATGLRPLVATLPTRVVDLDYVADYLAGGWVSERADEACAYRGVQRVRADTMVTVDPASGAVHRVRYWDWLAHVEDPGTDRMDDAGVRYRELLADAVRARLSGVCAAHLSGGLDSTTICLLALDQLRTGSGGALPLHALALVYDRLPQLSRERRYVEAVLDREAPDLMGHRIVADTMLDFDGFDDPPFHDEPFVRAPFIESQLALVRAAVGAGAATVLTGEGADDLLVVSGRHIADLARHGRLGTAWRAARRQGAARNTSGGSIFYREVVAPVSTGWRRRLAAAGLAGHGRRAPHHDETSVPPWIAPGFAHRYELADRFAAQRRRRRRRPGSTLVWSDALAGLETRVGDGYRMALAAPYGVSLSHPFLDPRVLGFALGALRRLAPEPAPQKPLLAAAMAGVLPDEIRLRPAKRGFNEVYSLGLHRHRAQLEALACAGDEFGIVEPATLLATIDEATLATAEPSQSRPMDMTLSLLSWLSRQEQWQSANPAPSEVHRLCGER